MRKKNGSSGSRYVFAAVALLAATAVFSASSCQRKEASPSLSAAFEQADLLIAVAGAADSVYPDYGRDVTTDLETLLSECSMLKSALTKSKDQVALARIINDLSILFNDAQNLGDAPTKEQLREYNAAWLKLRDRFEMYVPAARKPPPEAPKEYLQQ